MSSEAGKNLGNDNPTQLWTCPMCGETIKCVNRADHITDHD